MSFDALDGLIPPGLLSLSLFVAASSGTFFFIWRTFGQPIITKSYRSAFLDVTIREEEPLYIEFNHWLHLNRDLLRFVRTFKAVEIDNKKVRLVPSYGTFMVIGGGYPLTVVSRTREEEGLHRHDSFEIRMYFAGENRVAKFFEELVGLTEMQSDIVHKSSSGYWYRSGVRKDVSRLFSSVALQFESEVRRFLLPETRKVYEDRCVPYRVGYLLSGIPGSGKSNAIAYVSKSCDLPIYVVSGDDPSTNFEELLTRLPQGRTVMLVIEDVDLTGFSASRSFAVGSDNGNDAREDSDEGETSHKKGLMLHNLLNSLDGIIRSDNFVFVCTTNNIDDLDEALLRPGRVDRILDFGYLTTREQLSYVNHYYGTDYDRQYLPRRTIAELANIVSMNLYSDEDCMDQMVSSVSSQSPERIGAVDGIHS